MTTYQALKLFEPKSSLSGGSGTSKYVGTVWALPNLPNTRLGYNVTWQLVYSSAPSAVSCILEVSLDNTNWFTIDTSTATAGEKRTLPYVMAKFIRITQSSRTGGAFPADLIMVA